MIRRNNGLTLIEVLLLISIVALFIPAFLATWDSIRKPHEKEQQSQLPQPVPSLPYKPEVESSSDLLSDENPEVVVSLKDFVALKDRVARLEEEVIALREQASKALNKQE